MPDPSGRRGWSGWLRRTGLQYAGPPVVTDVRLVADESALVAAMPGAWGKIGCQSNAGAAFEFTGVILVAGPRGCWYQTRYEVDAGDSMLELLGVWLGAHFPGGGLGADDGTLAFAWNVIPTRLAVQNADPLFPIETTAWTGNSNAIGVSNPSAYVEFAAQQVWPQWNPRQWLPPGRALLMAQEAEDPTVFRVNIVIEEPGSQPAAP